MSVLEIRSRLAEDIRSENDHARIADLLLDPRADVIPRAIHRYEAKGTPFPTTERDQISEYVDMAIRRHVSRVSFGSDDPDPFAWGDMFARACVRGGVKEVQRARARSSLFEPSDMAESGIVEFIGISAEEAFLEARRFRDVDLAGDAIDRATDRFERMRVIATQLCGIWGLPAPHVTSRTARRELHDWLESADRADMIVRSLECHRSIAAGLSWTQGNIPDDVLDLWMDYTSEQCDDLLTRAPHMIVAIVRGHVLIPPPPSKAARVAIRREMKLACVARGWSALMMRVESAWVAEHFLARDPEHQGRDARSDEEAEALRAYTAQSWPEYARRAAAFAGSPLGSSIDEVTARIESIWERVRTSR